jgi:hypothetical protein
MLVLYTLYLNAVFIDVCNKLGRHLTNGWFTEDELLTFSWSKSWVKPGKTSSIVAKKFERISSNFLQ